MNSLPRFMTVVRRRCGRSWPAVVKTADASGTGFIATFLVSITARTFSSTAIWSAAGLATGVAFVIALVSVGMFAVTGQTALGGLVSDQLRAQRDIRPVQHRLPLRPVTKETRRVP